MQAKRKFNRHTTRQTVGFFFCSAAVILACGCESPLRPQEFASQQYLDKVIAQAVLDGSYASRYTQMPTLYAGVRALAPVQRPLPVNTEIPAPETGMSPPPPDPDAPPMPQITAPATATQPVIGAARVPPPIPGLNMPVDKIGLIAATLNMPERVHQLSLQHALASGMKNSLAIKVEAYNPAIRESQVVQQEAVFDPVFFGSSQWTGTDEPINQKPPISALSNGQFWQNQLGIKQTLSSGAQMQATANMNYRDIEAPNTALGSLLFSNSYSTSLNLQFTQPLLRGFGPAVNEANIYISRADYGISLSKFKQQAITTAANIEEAYLNLYLARNNLEIVTELVRQSLEARNRVYARETIDANEASKAQVDAAVASHGADLIRFQAAYRTASDALKVLLNDPEYDVRDNSLINPSDEPITQQFRYSAEQLMQTALSQRPEMQQARLQLEQTDIAIRVAKNGLLPKFDLTAGIQSNGLNADIDQAFNSAVSDGRWIDFSVGVRFEIPLGNRDAEAKLVERKLNRNQGLTQIANLAQQIVTDVITQLRSQYSNSAQLETNVFAVESYDRQLRALIAQEEISRLTPEFLQLKLNTQVQLALAKQTLIQTQVNYNIAIMRLEQAKGTLLEYDRISLDHPPIKSDSTKPWLMGRSMDK